MAKKLIERLTDAKSRSLVLLIAAGVIALLILFYFLFSSGTPAEKETSQAPKIPEITSVPGQVTSEKYQQLLEQSNIKRAEEAKKQGTSAVATIIGSREKDILAKKESFGIEDEFLKGAGGECKCPSVGTGTEKPCTPPIDNITLANLTKQIEANENDAIRLMKANPCLASRLAQTRPDLLKKLMQNPEFAKQFAQLYPDVLKNMMKNDPIFAEQMMKQYPDIVNNLLKNDPAFADSLCKNTLDDATLEKLTKQIEADENSAIALMKANPCLAKRLEETNPALLKKLMQNPAFAKAFSNMYPDIVKSLMKNDPDFAKQMYEKYPDMVKDLMKNDNDFAKTIAKNNPEIMKDLMLKDPEFARLMAKNNPDMLKELMRMDPAFAEALGKTNPTLVKELMKNDPTFARQMAQVAPNLVKQLMKDDPDFARAMATASPAMVNDLMKSDPEFAKSLMSNTPGLMAILENALPKSALSTDQARIAALEEERRRRQAQQAEEAKQLQLSDLQQKQVANVVSNMEGQTKAVFQAWNEVTQQQFVAGEWRSKEDKDKSNPANGENGSLLPGNDATSSSASGSALIKAGTILYAVLDTAINTDEPGPIMATIVAGPFIGAKAIGALQFVQQPGTSRPEKVTLNFTTLTPPNQPKSLSFSAVALDPDTARTALASNVDHHYLLRYGTLFASSFMQGYGKVIASMGTTQTTSATGQTTTTTPQLSTRQQIFAALGQVGQNFGQAFTGYFNMPNTITVNSGTSIGLLILNDVTGS